jgi:hypothetical protein
MYIKYYIEIPLGLTKCQTRGLGNINQHYRLEVRTCLLRLSLLFQHGDSQAFCFNSARGNGILVISYPLSDFSGRLNMEDSKTWNR